MSGAPADEAAAEPDAGAASIETLVGRVVAELVRRELSIAVAESLTGGLLVAALVGVPGVSAVLRGGVVAYDTRVKRELIGVDAALLAEHGPVHPEVAAQLADRVRRTLAVDGTPARVGLGTTGVAGPGAAEGHPAGEAYVAAALDGEVRVRALPPVEGDPRDRRAIREAAVSESLTLLVELLAPPHPLTGTGE